MLEDNLMVWQTHSETISRILFPFLDSSSSTVSMLTSSELLTLVLRLAGDMDLDDWNSGLGQLRVNRGMTSSINSFLVGNPFAPPLPFPDGPGDLYEEIKALYEAEWAAIEADIEAVYSTHLRKSGADATAEEVAPIESFAGLMAAKTKEVPELAAPIEAKSGHLGEASMSLVRVQEGLTDTKEAIQGQVRAAHH